MNITDKKVIVFDLDGTLVDSKQGLTGEMSNLLGQLLSRYQVCVVSGESFEQFDRQLISRLSGTSHKENLHIMPTCGTRYFRFKGDHWHEVYAEELPADDRRKIAETIEEGAKELGIWETKTWGEVIEDRGTQVTFSGLGQQAPLDDKAAWDPNSKKRLALREYLLEHLPGYEVEIAGTTSVDVTAAGIDKAYGVAKLQKLLNLQAADILFVGDQLGPGGNDHPVKAAGYQTVAVKSWQQTVGVIEDLIK